MGIQEASLVTIRQELNDLRRQVRDLQSAPVMIVASDGSQSLYADDSGVPVMTGSTVQSSPAGSGLSRWQGDTAGIHFYDASGNQTIDLDAVSGNAKISGKFQTAPDSVYPRTVLAAGPVVTTEAPGGGSTVRKTAQQIGVNYYSAADPTTPIPFVGTSYTTQVLLDAPGGNPVPGTLSTGSGFIVLNRDPVSDSAGYINAGPNYVNIASLRQSSTGGGSGTGVNVQPRGILLQSSKDDGSGGTLSAGGKIEVGDVEGIGDNRSIILTAIDPTPVKVVGDLNVTGNLTVGGTAPGSGATAPTGSLLPWAGAAGSPPTGYLVCDGSSLLRAGTYAALFAVVGTTYGAVDGTHFNLPNLKGKVVVGVDGSDTDFASAGLTGGAKTVAGAAHTHVEAAHTHTSAAHSHVLSDNGAAQFVQGSTIAASRRITAPGGGSYTETIRSNTTVGTAISGQTLATALMGATDSTTPGVTGSTSPGNTGSTTPTATSVVQPFMALAYIIKT